MAFFRRCRNIFWAKMAQPSVEKIGSYAYGSPRQQVL